MTDKASVRRIANASKLPDDKTSEVASLMAVKKMAKPSKKLFGETHVRIDATMPSHFQLEEPQQPNHIQTAHQERIKQQQQQPLNFPRGKQQLGGRVLGSEKIKTLSAQQAQDCGPSALVPESPSSMFIISFRLYALTTYFETYFTLCK